MKVYSDKLLKLITHSDKEIEAEADNLVGRFNNQTIRAAFELGMKRATTLALEKILQYEKLDDMAERS